MTKKIIKISIDHSNLDFPLDTIGIDMGQSLTKIAYVEGSELYLSLLPTQLNIEGISEFLDSMKKKFRIFNFTGGKAFDLHKSISLDDWETNLFNEFQAITNGIENLYLLNKKTEFPESLIITIGTGTSINLKRKGSVKHLGGSALGGGFFRGIIKLLYNINDFQEAIKLANKGNRFNIDLKVSDIYNAEDERVDTIFREFTASSFGKINDIFKVNNTVRQEDVINSIINIIGESVGVIACQMANIHDITQLIFCGGFLKENRIVKRGLKVICSFNNKKAIFLKNSEFAGALGALLG